MSPAKSKASEEQLSAVMASPFSIETTMAFALVPCLYSKYSVAISTGRTAAIAPATEPVMSTWVDDLTIVSVLLNRTR